MLGLLQSDDPLRPFDLRKGRFGLGALELTARYSELELGKSVFTGHLADPNLWSREAQMVDVGFNWYLNTFVRMQFNWERAYYAQPINIGASNRLFSSTDALMTRLQLIW